MKFCKFKGRKCSYLKVGGTSWWCHKLNLWHHNIPIWYINQLNQVNVTVFTRVTKLTKMSQQSIKFLVWNKKVEMEMINFKRSKSTWYFSIIKVVVIRFNLLLFLSVCCAISLGLKLGFNWIHSWFLSNTLTNSLLSHKIELNYRIHRLSQQYQIWSY